LLAQPDVDPAVLVVVEGKLDGTEEQLASYQSNRVQTIVNQQVGGASRARNRGLNMVKSPYVMFLDADDFVEGPLLADLLHRMDAAGADVGFGPMEILDEWTGRRHSRFVPDFASANDLLMGWHLGDRFLSPCSILWRTEFLRAVGGWDEELTRNDDGELVMRAALKGARFVNGTQGKGIYVKHSRETLSNRTDNLGSMLLANEKLLTMPSESVSRDVHVRACAGHYFKVAWQCFYAGQDELGRNALERSRELGFGGTLGPRSFRIMSAILGLRTAARLSRFRRRLIGFPRGQVSQSLAGCRSRDRSR
jgi:glycosyltransferase involved in cell wall biosynthesis